MMGAVGWRDLMLGHRRDLRVVRAGFGHRRMRLLRLRNRRVGAVVVRHMGNMRLGNVRVGAVGGRDGDSVRNAGSEEDGGECDTHLEVYDGVRTRKIVERIGVMVVGCWISLWMMSCSTQRPESLYTHSLTCTTIVPVSLSARLANCRAAKRSGVSP